MAKTATTIDATALDETGKNPYPLVASPAHTVIMVAILGIWALVGTITAGYMRVATNPHRVRTYLLSTLGEWLWFAFVVAGARTQGVPLRLIMGDRWDSARTVLRDIGIAANFWIVSITVLLVPILFLRVSLDRRSLDFIHPKTPIELALWIAVSITAGIVEETVFRGYLQMQFASLTRSIPTGIFLSAVIFGACHAYQGWIQATLMALLGLMFGILAYWRKSLRPGMFAHAWQDGLGGILAFVLKH